MRVRRLTRGLEARVAAAIGWTHFRVRRKRGCTILMYHSIRSGARSSGYRYAVEPRTFANHLDYLKDRFRVIPLPEVSRRLRSGDPLPDRTAALTFDDGYRDNLTDALPLLEERDLPATIFLVTSFVESGLRTFLDWSDVRTMNESPLLTFGAHTHRHLTLTALDAADAEEEIRRSKEEIEERLGEEVRLFSYPGGSRDEAVEAGVRRCGFEAAFVDRPTGELVDPFSVGRVNIDRRHEVRDVFALDLASCPGVRRAAT